MKSIIVVLTSVFLNLTAHSFELAPCLDKQTSYAYSQNQLPNSLASENLFEFKRLNEEVLFVKAGQYFFPEFPNKVQDLAIFVEEQNGYPIFSSKTSDLKYMISCDNKMVFVLMENSQVPPYVEALTLK